MHSVPKGTGEIQGKISGRVIIEQLVRNMELGQFEMGYSVLVPCIFSIYLHPDDHARLIGVMLCGDSLDVWDFFSRRIVDETFLLYFNAYHEAIALTRP